MNYLNPCFKINPKTEETLTFFYVICEQMSVADDGK